MFKLVRGIIYGVFFILMGIAILYDTRTSESLSVAMQAIDNVYGAATFGIGFILCGLLNLYTGWTQREWVLIGFAPFLIYGTVIAYVSVAFGAVSLFGNLVFLLLATIMLSDWFLDTGVVNWLGKRGHVNK